MKSLLVLNTLTLVLAAGATLRAAELASETSAVAPQLLETSRAAISMDWLNGFYSWWTAGTFLQLDHPLRQGSPTLRVSDKDGVEFVSVPFALPGAARLRLEDLKRTPDGTLVTCGTALAGDLRESYFASVIAANGRSQQVLQLTPFQPRACALAPGGVLWVAGAEMDSKKRDSDVPEYNVLRWYDSSGRQLGSLVPRSSVKARRPAFWWPAHRSKLAVGRDRIGWYSDAAGEYFEFSFDGKELTRIPTVPLTSRYESGMARLTLCDNGQVYVGKYPSGPTVRIFGLDRGSGSWSQVYMDSTGDGLMLGCDSNNDVVALQRLLGGQTVLKWLRPAEAAVH